MTRDGREIVVTLLAFAAALITSGDAVAQHANPVLQAEHEAVMRLIPDSAVTHEAVAGGNWSSSATWRDGAVPGAGATVLIPYDVTVTFDAPITPAIGWLRIDGTLAFATTRSAELLVGTIIVTHHGTMTMGTTQAPIPANVTATITFADLGEIDAARDPGLFSRGLVSHGAVEMCGEGVTPYSRLAQPAVAGDTQLTLEVAPANWAPRDAIVLAGVNSEAAEDERLLVAAVEGNTVTVDRPLRYTHAGPGKLPHVGHLTRNVVLRSQSPAIGRRGHAMFMHSDDVHLHGAAFVDLGRTDKSKPLSTANIIGRYSVHLHRAGHENAVTIANCVSDGTPGWGIVNHSSHVLVTDCVSTGATGAAFAAEAGDEIGSFERCLAVRSTGKGLTANPTIDSRFATQDFAHEGHGFWLQGNAVRVVDCVAAGHPAVGFAFNSFGLTQTGLGQMKFPTAALPDPSLFGAKTEVPVDVVPFTEVRSIESYACRFGLLAWRQNQSTSAPLVSVVDRFTAWHCPLAGIHAGFQTAAEYHNCDLIGMGKGYGIRSNQPYGRQLSFIGCDVRNWATGLFAPQFAQTTVTDCVFIDNTLDVDAARLESETTRPRDLRLSGDQVTVRLGPGPQPLTSQTYGPASYFQQEKIMVGARQLYWREQGADHVLFPSATPFAWVPWSLRNRTNQQLRDEYGLCFLDAMAPADAVPFADGLLGGPSEYGPVMVLQSPRFTPLLESGYRLAYTVAGKLTRETQDTVLVSGWNVVTREIDGVKRSVFIYGDRLPPSFTPTSTLEVHRANLTKPYTVTGWLDDDLRGRYQTSQTVDLRQFRLVQRPDGSEFVEVILQFVDLAGNTSQTRVDVAVR